MHARTHTQKLSAEIPSYNTQRKRLEKCCERHRLSVCHLFPPHTFMKHTHTHTWIYTHGDTHKITEGFVLNLDLCSSTRLFVPICSEYLESRKLKNIKQKNSGKILQTFHIFSFCISVGRLRNKEKKIPFFCFPSAFPLLQGPNLSKRGLPVPLKPLLLQCCIISALARRPWYASKGHERSPSPGSSG